MRQLALLAAFALLLSTNLASARAPDTFEEMYTKPSVIESPEWYAFELRIGPYQPNVGNSAFDDSFGGDRGWLLAAELDFHVYRIPYVGLLGIGLGAGWADYEGDARDQGTGAKTSEDTDLILYPMNAMGVLRIDGIARHLDFPLLFTGKIGYDFVRWTTSTGKREDASGLSTGLRWAVQAALDLNFFERDSARALDEDWGINRTFLLFEFYESKAEGDSLPVGDRTFSFGLGLTF